MAWSRVFAFADPLPCAAALQSTTQAEILPTERGRFEVQVTQIVIEKLRMQRFTVALPQIATVAISPDRKAIGFLTEASASSLQHCGLEVMPNNILVYGHDVLHQRSSYDFRYGVMSLPAKDFPVLCKTIMGREFLAEPRTSIVRPDPDLMTRLLKMHKVVAQLAHDTPDILEQEEVHRALEEQLIHIMIRCLAKGAGVETATGDRRHYVIVKRFEDYLAAHPDRPLYLTEICAGIGVAERTLRAACEEHLGMGPIRFLTLRRMHLARRALLSADAGNATVTRIATDHGFWELGRFAVAYRALFEESPSETLRRPAKQLIRSLNRPSSLLAEFAAGHPH
jgi:AraC-like DNA-binding protein